ncbi:MAG: DUF192 domain-containing protein [Candidatus Brocadiaceae bacterium]|jgi:uncharacterized membrane protein (UPF0127 family)
MKWGKHIIIFIAVFALVGILLGRGGCMGQGGGAGRPPDAQIVRLRVPGQPQADYRAEGSYVLRAEVADTPEKRKKGLAGRSGLEPGYGMLYVYPEPEQPTFSFGGTSFPLSVAFLKEDGTIVALHQAGAGDSSEVAPPEPVRYVLEVRRGWFADRDLQEGDALEFEEEHRVEPSAPTAGPEVPAETPLAE